MKDSNPYPCTFKLSSNGGCVGTVHDRCKNCNKRAKFIMQEIKAEKGVKKVRYETIGNKKHENNQH